MSQQTRIEAMIPYYNRFIDRYPTLADLALADDDELTKLWQGLGYYARVRNMKKAARVCMEEYDGKLPKTKKELKKLPGIGDYTAGAIASIANNERCTAIDGNVIRVGSRYYWLEQDFNIPKNKKWLDEFLQDKLPEEDEMSDFTQAMMELGARICTPKVARCDTCPIRETCIGATKENPCVLPVAKKKLEQKTEEKNVLIVAGWKEGQWWIHLNQRNKNGLLAGMFEFDENWTEFQKIQNEVALSSGNKQTGDCEQTPMVHDTDGQFKVAPIYGKYDLQTDDFVFSHKIWKMKGELIISEVGNGFSSLQEIESEKAIPTAYAKMYQRALDQLSKVDPKEKKENR